jgi:hypothetical protein
MIGILWNQAQDFARRLPELYTDPKDGTLSHTRIGMIVAGLVFTVKMAAHMPDSWELWLTYMGTVGGYAVARQWVAGKAQQNQ